MGEAVTAQASRGSDRGGSDSGAGTPAAADAEAVERARGGDHAAFRVLVERYQGRVFGLALRVLRDEEQARDVVQDAFLKAYGSLDRFEGRSGFYTWLYRIAMNLCLDRKRRERGARRVARDEEALLEAPADPESVGAPAPGVALERAELRAQLARAIAGLPDEARRTLELREVDGLSYHEIAEALGVPKGTVMSRLHHARRRVREALAAAGALEAGAPGDGAEEE